MSDLEESLDSFEVREIKCINSLPGSFTDITLAIGSKQTGDAEYIYKVYFPNPRRVDAFSDDLLDEANQPNWKNTKDAFPNFPDIYECQNSKYLKSYQKGQDGSQNLRHFLIHTDANGLVHILTHHHPVLTKVPESF